MFSRSCRHQTRRTPKGEMARPRWRSSFDNPGLFPGGSLDGDLDNGLLGLGIDAVLRDRLSPADLLPGHLPACLVEVLEAVEAVAAIAHHLAGLADVAGLLALIRFAAQARTPSLGRVIFWFVAMGRSDLALPCPTD